MVILEVRVFHLQILEGNKYKILSEKNRIRIVREPAPRGIIFDRNGIPLVVNQYKYQVYFPEEVLTSKERVRKKLERIFSLKIEEILKDFNRREFGKVVLVKKGVEVEDIVKIVEDFDLLDAIVVKVPYRKYCFKSESIAHLIGHTGEITKEKFEILKDKGYKLKDIIGLDGIEYFYDRILRGEDGGSELEVDAQGRVLKTIGYKEPVPGANIYLTIDRRIQEIASQAMEGKKGAVIVMNPENGEILAMVSKPSYPLEIFDKINLQEWKDLQNHKSSPFQNRAISAKYPPGSVFKIITAIAALENNLVNEKETFECKGTYKVGNRVFRCWERKGHGKICLLKGIAHSCDVVFYELGKRAGASLLKKFSYKFGLGNITGIDLPGEVKGLVPDRRWKRIHFRENRWFLGDTINMSIGQGFLQTTPLQIAVMTSIVANGGYRVKPHLLKKIEKNGEEKYISFKKLKIDLKEKNLKILKEGMKLAVEEGTGRFCKIPFLKIAGKTGTADDPPKKKPHAWFVGFAPYENPQYCVAVVVEEGGKGGEVAAPVAREIFEKIFTTKKETL